MLGIPKFTNVQKILKRAFYNNSGILHVFTEDKMEDQVFYKLLLNRLSNGTFTISKITPLGSRADVMKASLQDKKPKAPTLYIIDGDIDLLMNDPIESKNLIGLDRYCVENYVCCEEGILSLLETNFGKTREYYKTKLQFESTLHKFCKSFLKIAIRYHVAQNLKCSTGFKKATDFFYIRTGIFKLDAMKVNDEINRVEEIIKAKLKQNKIKAYSTEMVRLVKAVEQKSKFSVSHYLKVLSGKDFLLPVLEKKVKMVDSRLTGWSTDQFKRNLAERIDITSLDRVKLKMEKLVK